jgi:hypothetical protein
MSIEAKPQGLPFQLKPTSIKGVYSFVPPPKGTDLTNASRSTLLKHGVLMRRPDPDREPKLFALWRRFVTEIWTEENFVEPTFGTPETLPHNHKGGHPQTEGAYTSYSGWNGVVVPGKWVGAIGLWQVPKVSAPATPVGPDEVWQSSSWVGLDGPGGWIKGVSSTDVLQAGVSQNVIASSGKAVYYAWYEWYVPNLSVSNEFPYVYPIPITSVPVKPGDEISVVIQYVTKKGAEIGNPTPPAGPYDFGGVLLTNVTTGKSVNLYLSPPTGASFAGDCAEWIMECPDGYARDTLPKFSSVNFNNATACGVGGAAGAPGSGDTVTYEDFEGFVETKVTTGEAAVNITYQG